MIKPYVYQLTHPKTGEFYFGYRYANILPAEEDFGVVYRTSSKEILERGFDTFVGSILEEFDSDIEAYEFEQRLIKQNINDPLCLNKHFVDVDNGKHHFRFVGEMTDETRAKMSASHRGKKFSEEHKRRIGESNLGNKLPFVPKTADHRLKIAEALAGKPKTQEHRKKVGDAHRGKLHTEEHTKKISKALSKNWLIIYPDGTELIINNLKQFCLENDLGLSGLYQVASGKIKSHKGYRCVRL